MACYCNMKKIVLILLSLQHAQFNEDIVQYFLLVPKLFLGPGVVVLMYHCRTYGVHFFNKGTKIATSHWRWKLSIHRNVCTNPVEYGVS
jgi:hypothetical protein